MWLSDGFSKLPQPTGHLDTSECGRHGSSDDSGARTLAETRTPLLQAVFGVRGDQPPGAIR